MGELVWLVWLGVIASSCARSGVELDTMGGDGVRGGSGAAGDDDESGGTTSGGATQTGGVTAMGGTGMSGIGAEGAGGSAAGGKAGSGGSPEPMIPNCRADTPVIVERRDNRWLYVEGRSNAQELVGLYLAEITPNGARNVHFLAELGLFRNWSASGRFLAFIRLSRTEEPVLEVYDFFKGGLPVLADVPPDVSSGRIVWSHLDGRYAQVGRSEEDRNWVSIVDAKTGVEMIADLPLRSSDEVWSGDDRFIALASSEGSVLVESSTGMVLSLHDEPSSDLAWSPDSRYLAFRSRHRDEQTQGLHLYDTRLGTFELVDETDHINEGLDFEWAGNAALIATRGTTSFFFDLEQRPLAPTPLADHADQVPIGDVSPGYKCYVYTGRCEATNELGVCVKALPPDPQKPSMLLERRSDDLSWAWLWAGTGDQLLLRTSREPWLVNIDLDGGGFTRRIVTEGTDTDSSLYGARWDPSGRPDWVLYAPSPYPEEDPTIHPRFWHRGSGASFDVALGAGSWWGGAWSPDGRYLFIESGNSPTDAALSVQEVLDHELGPHVSLSELMASPQSGIWPYHWQP